LKRLETLIETTHGRLLRLPKRLARLYGRLRLPTARAPSSRSRGRPYVIGNFVSTLDGIVSLAEKGHASGGDISGFSIEDRMLMGLLRAVADAVIVGAGTLEVDRRHVWTAERMVPRLAPEYRALRAALGKRGPQRVVVVSGSGRIDLGLPVFASGEMHALIVTSAAGARRLRKQHVPASTEIRVAQGGRALKAKSILKQIQRASPGRLLLVEGGPRLLGDFLADGVLDEQFLTLAPQIAGREAGDRRLSLVMGRTFAPRSPLFGELTDLRRCGSHLFLRYRFPRKGS
jgi:riboflavin biosynthesis pyrimidine reductase